jgi:DNA polymerase III delta prime subunit
MLNIHENIKEKLDYFQSIHKIPNIIFHGPTGSGKRTIVNEFIHKIYENNREKINERRKQYYKNNHEKTS